VDEVGADEAGAAGDEIIAGHDPPDVVGSGYMIIYNAGGEGAILVSGKGRGSGVGN
jgi:hypothetical protein